MSPTTAWPVCSPMPMRSSGSPRPWRTRPGAPSGPPTTGGIGWVASGVAEHLGLPVLWVRMSLVALIAFGGFGAVLYAGLWLFLPARRHPDPLTQAWPRPPGRASARAADRAADPDDALGGRGGDRPRSAAGGHDDHRPDACTRAAPARRCRSRPAVVAGRRGAAATLARPRDTWVRSRASSVAADGGPTCASVRVSCSPSQRSPCSPCARAACPWRSAREMHSNGSRIRRFSSSFA